MVKVTELVVLEPDTPNEYCWWVEREVFRFDTHDIAQEFPYMKDFAVTQSTYIRDKVRDMGTREADIEHGWQRNRYLERLEFLEKYLYWLKNASGKNNARQSFEQRIQRAREYPLTNLIDVLPGDKAYCIYHDERTPSVKIYRNQNKGWAYCCQKSIDPISVVMHKVGCDFKTAVKRLT